MLTSTQAVTLAADILLDPILAAYPHTSDGAFAVAEAYNLGAMPAFWVWRTQVGVQEIYEVTTADATSWSWSTYIGRTPAERDGWRELSAPGFLNFALPNVRAAITDIFSGTLAPAVAQRLHLATIGRRQALRVEKLFASGTGSTTSLATMGREGILTFQDVLFAWGM